MRIRLPIFRLLSLISLAASSAKKVAVCNLMTKWGETTNFKASDMLRELSRYSGIEKFDVALCNTGPMDKNVLEKYALEKQFPIVCDERVNDFTGHVLKGDFESEGDIARHDADKIAQVLSELA